MNTKFYVPFETAKRLKAQGYPQSGSDMYYNPNAELKTQVELIAGYKEYYPITALLLLTRGAVREKTVKFNF